MDHWRRGGCHRSCGRGLLSVQTEGRKDPRSAGRVRKRALRVDEEALAMARVAMLGLVLLAGLSCTKKVTQEGGLELMLMSDFPVTDLTRVHLEISQEIAPGEWHKVFDREQLVPQEVS